MSKEKAKNNDPRRGIIKQILFNLAITLSPALWTALFILGSERMFGTQVSTWDLRLFSQTTYFYGLGFIFLAGLIIYILLIRKNELHAIGLVLQVMIIVVVFLYWMIFDPNIRVTDTKVDDDITYHAVLYSHVGDGYMKIFVCEDNWCTLHDIEHVDSTPFRDATIELNTQTDIIHIQLDADYADKVCQFEIATTAVTCEWR